MVICKLLLPKPSTFLSDEELKSMLSLVEDRDEHSNLCGINIVK